MERWLRVGGLAVSCDASTDRRREGGATSSGTKWYSPELSPLAASILSKEAASFATAWRTGGGAWSGG